MQYAVFGIEFVNWQAESKRIYGAAIVPYNRPIVFTPFPDEYSNPPRGMTVRLCDADTNVCNAGQESITINGITYNSYYGIVVRPLEPTIHAFVCSNNSEETPVTSQGYISYDVNLRDAIHVARIDNTGIYAEIRSVDAATNTELGLVSFIAEGTGDIVIDSLPAPTVGSDDPEARDDTVKATVYTGDKAITLVKYNAPYLARVRDPYNAYIEVCISVGSNSVCGKYPVNLDVYDLIVDSPEYCG